MILKLLHNRGKVSGVKVLRAGPRQNFWPSLLTRGVGEGWLSMERGRIVLHGEDGLVVYRIVRMPGRYPDDSPAGYRIDNFYACERED